MAGLTIDFRIEGQQTQSRRELQEEWRSRINQSCHSILTQQSGKYKREYLI
jgi:hypothetical protein